MRRELHKDIVFNSKLSRTTKRMIQRNTNTACFSGSRNRRLIAIKNAFIRSYGYHLGRHEFYCYYATHVLFEDKI